MSWLIFTGHFKADVFIMDAGGSFCRRGKNGLRKNLRFYEANRQCDAADLAIFIVILSIFLGIEVISHVPAILHTPLMSGANAIHGVVIIGAIIVMGHAGTTGSMILGFIAVVLGTLNVVGGFVVTDRMLEMFKKKK